MVRKEHMSIDRYINIKPKLNLEDFFSGKLLAWGLFEDVFGIIRKKFTCKISGDWNSTTKTLTIVEDFIYDDGVKENRVWKLIKTDNDTYEGRTENVVGIAKGYTRGNVFYWKYSFQLPLYGRKTKVNFNDYMYLQDNNVIINKAKMSKFGIKLGTVYLFFKKH